MCQCVKVSMLLSGHKVSWETQKFVREHKSIEIIRKWFKWGI